MEIAEKTGELEPGGDRSGWKLDLETQKADLLEILETDHTCSQCSCDRETLNDETLTGSN